MYRRRRLAAALALALGVAALSLTWSYTSALTAPGSTGLGVRSVEWLRGHGGGGLVAWVEDAWYSHHAPPVGGRPRPGLIPSATGHVGLAAPPPLGAGLHHLAPPAPIAPIARPPITGEGVWEPVGRPVGGVPAVYAAYLRPDPVHTSLVTGVAWMDTSLLAARLFSGSEVPGGSHWANMAPISPALRPALVAAFNSGFRLQDSRGGYYAEGKMVQPLVDGVASLVIYRDGTATVGQWGRDVSFGPAVSAVRQNLSLIVDHGRLVAGLGQDDTRRWGATLGNKILVWRSGLGVTADGALVYAGGQGLSVGSLAEVLARAGAVRAMELDINTDWVNFFSFDPAPGAAASPANGAKLVSDMVRPTSRYFEPSERDFIVMFAR